MGVVNVQLEKGPQGMTLSPQGRIAWTVPANHPVGNVEVQVNLKDLKDELDRG